MVRHVDSSVCLCLLNIELRRSTTWNCFKANGLHLTLETEWALMTLNSNCMLDFGVFNSASRHFLNIPCPLPLYINICIYIYELFCVVYFWESTKICCRRFSRTCFQPCRGGTSNATWALTLFDNVMECFALLCCQCMECGNVAAIQSLPFAAKLICAWQCHVDATSNIHPPGKWSQRAVRSHGYGASSMSMMTPTLGITCRSLGTVSLLLPATSSQQLKQHIRQFWHYRNWFGIFMHRCQCWCRRPSICFGNAEITSEVENAAAIDIT